MLNKSSLRKNFRSYRRSINQKQRADFECKIINEIEAFHSKKAWKIIASYSAQDGEPNIAAWHASAIEQGSLILLPRVKGDRKMTFHTYQRESELEFGKYDIAEPRANSEVIAKEKIDCFLMPLVSYDKQGNRLGMGGGYYDTYLSDYKQTKRPFLLGIAFSNQFSSERLPTVKTDIKLDGVVNEKGFFCFNHTR